MTFAARVPSPPLDRFVDRLWMLADAPAHARERILPGGTLELVVDLRNENVRIYDVDDDVGRSHASAVVSGTYARPFAIDTRQHAAIVGVHFKPGGAPALLGVPAHELADRHVDLADMWSTTAANELREQLCTAGTTAQRFDRLEAALLRHCGRGRPAHPAVRAALRVIAGGEDISVATLARTVGLGERRFVDVFCAAVGMTPKRFQRVHRFRRAAAIVRGSPTLDWCRIALECGYCDQSHLIREFRELSGLTPAQLREASSEGVKDDHLIDAATR